MFKKISRSLVSRKELNIVVFMLFSETIKCFVVDDIMMTAVLGLHDRYIEFVHDHVVFTTFHMSNVII